MLNNISGGKFKDRKLTADEQAVKDAWDKRMAKTTKTKTSSKPKSVVQNGITYNWNESKQTYE